MSDSESTQIINREQKIFSLVSSLLCKLTELDEVTIDAEFLFRFDPRLCQTIANILIRGTKLIKGEPPTQYELETSALMLPFFTVKKAPYITEEDRMDLSIHIDMNAGIHEGIGLSGINRFVPIQEMGQQNDKYIPSMILQKEFNDLFTTNFSENELKRLHFRSLIEEAQTRMVQSDLVTLGILYGVFPSESERVNYSLKELKKLMQQVVNWVLLGEEAGVRVPHFIWPTIRLNESKPGKGILRQISVHQANNIPNHNRRMTQSVRIRTWGIYFLTKRGGGRRSEEVAVDLWNNAFSTYTVSVENFRKERLRLFKEGSQKRVK